MTDYTYDTSKVQIIANIAKLILPNTSATIQENFVMNALTFIGMTENVNKAGSDDIKYHFAVNGAYVYFNGSAWVSSDRSYSQSNDVSTININAATLIVGGPKTLQWEATFKGSGTTSPELQLISIDYINEPIFAQGIDRCVVFCYLSDLLGQDLTTVNNAKLIAINDSPFMNNGHIIPRFYEESSFSFDGAGFIAYLSLVQTEDSNKKIRFMVTYELDGFPSRVETVRFNPCIIPEQASADLVDISSINTNQIL